MGTYKPCSHIAGDLERFGAASLYSRHRMAAGLWKTLSSDNSTCSPRR